MSVGTNQKTITTFLERSLTLASKLLFVIDHMDSFGRPSHIHTSTWDGNNPPLEEFRNQLWDAAYAHSSAIGGTQRFALKAFDLEDGKPQVGDAPINNATISVEGIPTGDGEPSEPANQVGLLAQLMRHNQEMMRLTIAATGALTSHLARTVETLSAKNEILMNERVHTIEVMEELYSRKDEREMEKQKVAAEIENKKLMWGKIMELAPIAINKLAGQELVRQRHSNLESTVMTFIETINPQKLDTIAKSGIFSERQMVLFGTILEQVMKTMITPEQKAEISATADRATVGDLGDIGLAAAAAIMGKK
jgi:hypothetical protein